MYNVGIEDTEQYETERGLTRAEVDSRTRVISFCHCNHSYEDAQASEEACLQRPPLWQKEGLVGPQ